MIRNRVNLEGGRCDATSIDRIPTLRARAHELFPPASADHERCLAEWTALRFPEHYRHTFEQHEHDAAKDEPRIPAGDIPCRDHRRHDEQLAPAREAQSPRDSANQARRECGCRDVAHYAVCFSTSTPPIAG